MCVLGVAAAVLLASRSSSGQIQYQSGQGISPDYQGWEPNPDGSFNLVFGYMNRNYGEMLHIPVGPDNNLEPGDPDQGQPTFFLPRRNRHLFRVRVPSDFGDQEIVWTLTANGRTERAYATLRSDYVLDRRVVYLNNTGVTMRGKADRNEAPDLRVEGDLDRRATVGDPLELAAHASDDGIPTPRAAMAGAVGFRPALGLRVAWFVYRGDGNTVTFDPEQFKVYPDFLLNSPWTPGWSVPAAPAGGRFPVHATFGAPGAYVLRVQAHDGGFESTRDVTVNVSP